MPYRSQLLGLIKRVECDRCGHVESPSYPWAALCSDCFRRDPVSFREECFHDSWEGARHGSQTVSCAICKSESPPQSFRYSCINCRSKHPDGTHSGSWGYAPHLDEGTDVDHCLSCSGVVVKSRESDSTTRVYYRVGSSAPVDGPFECPRNSETIEPIQRSCVHEYIELYSSAKFPEEAAEIRSELAANPFVVEMLSSDMAGLSHNLAYASEGSTHFWCWRCGYYLNLNPSRYSLLPKVGARD